MGERPNYIAFFLIIFTFFLGFFLGMHIEDFFLKKKKIESPEINREIRIPLVAISKEGEGRVEYGNLKIVNGSGKTYISINPFIEPDTQYSFEIAKNFVCSFLKKDCSKYDFILEIESKAELVGGPSAGLSFAIGLFCALQNRNVSTLIAATGTVKTDGKIGTVGNILEKAIAAAKNNKKYFFIPKGQSIIYTYEKIEEIREMYPGFVIKTIEYVPKPINITEEFYKKYNMYIVEVSDFSDLLKYEICL